MTIAINSAHELLRPHAASYRYAPPRRASCRCDHAYKLIRLFNDRDAELGGKIVGIYGVLIAANVLAWVWALIAFHDYPVLIGTAFLAYTFGLRHAVDADHIAAIDNVTRKLMQEGKRPLGVGFFFSLGHSTVVVLASAAIALTTSALQGRFDGVQAGRRHDRHAGLRAFLFVVAAANFVILLSVYRTFQRGAPRRRLRRGRPQSSVGAARTARPHLPAAVPADLAQLAHVSARLAVRPRLRHRDRDRRCSAFPRREASKGLPIWSIMVFPALFTAGMSLIDTTDGVLMLGAYGWAFTKPIRKLYYNLTITFVSVLVAVLIGGIEALGLVADRLNLEGPFWNFIGRLNDNFGSLGYLIIAIFVVSWLVSIAVYRLGRFDRLESRVNARA